MVKKALCCGLNYPNSEKYALYGCINDCLDWEDLLKNTFQFESRVLIDQYPDGSLATVPSQIPSRKNILDQLSWLCSGVEPGDCLVFVFAGHGCQVRVGQGRVDEALVPEDFGFDGGPQGAPSLVLEDEIHALFARLPSGAFLTLILDCCHGSRMLDAPCSVDTSQPRNAPGRTLQSCEAPREVPNRGESDRQKLLIPFAQARPRFVPTVSIGPRQRRTLEGSGAHVGRMTLDPGVTAFCFAACRTHEAALDANIKCHQCGVLSFCLLQALSGLRQLEPRGCTYAQLLDAASALMDDIREKYMENMEQHMQLSFCPNSVPSQVLLFDERYATVAQHQLSQQQTQRYYAAGSADGLRFGDGLVQPVREASTEFVPAPSYNPPENRGNLVVQGHANQGPWARLYLVIHAAHNLKNTDTGLLGDVSDPYTVARVGKHEHRTPTVNNNLDPFWDTDNHFTFQVSDQDTNLELEIWNSNHMKDDSLGRTSVDLRSLPPAQWHRLRQPLQDGEGELEFDVRLEPLQAQGPDQRQQAQQQAQQQQPPQQVSSPSAAASAIRQQQLHQQQMQQQQPISSGAPNQDPQFNQRPPSPGRQDLAQAYPEQNHHGGASGAYPGSRPGAATAADAPGYEPPGGAYGHGAPATPTGAPPPMRPPADAPSPFPDIFGAPNLLGAMPNLLSNMLSAAGTPQPASGFVSRMAAIQPCVPTTSYALPSSALGTQSPAVMYTVSAAVPSSVLAGSALGTQLPAVSYVPSAANLAGVVPGSLSTGLPGAALTHEYGYGAAYYATPAVVPEPAVATTVLPTTTVTAVAPAGVATAIPTTISPMPTGTGQQGYAYTTQTRRLY